MKGYLLVASLLMLFLTNLFGEVKNGYEKSIPGLMLSLKGLRLLHSNPGLSRIERRDIEKRIRLVIHHMAYYEITDRLLKQFRLIAPDLYDEMDTLIDARGRVVDIYVKYIPRSQTPFRALGISSLAPAPDDANSCISEYGERSVSITISVLNIGLRVLAHEFGHVAHVIPNMKSYAEFFRLRYRNKSLDLVFGHGFRDLSGKSAFLFERRFRRSHGQYLRRESTSFKSFVAEVKPIKRNLLETFGYE